MSGPRNHEDILRLAGELGRRAESLYALTAHCDPFYIYAQRQAAAQWFAELWQRLRIPVGFHYRKIHYRLISQAVPVRMLDGRDYQNTFECWDELGDAARDAAYLELVPPDAYEDRRNANPIIHLQEASDGYIGTASSRPELFLFQMPTLPRLTLVRPIVPQPYHIELWAEKTTMNDILEPLAQEYGLNLITGSGELSAIACRAVVDRALQSKRPVRVLYISDFDPAGRNMPVSVARKIEFDIARRSIDLDLQVRPVVLTHQQCIEHKLPRTPIKEGVKAGTAFENRFGEGATELDALEALHPGLLKKILTGEIERYWDPEHKAAVEGTCSDIKARLDHAAERAIAANQQKITALKAEWQELVSAYQAWQQRATPVWQAIADQLQENQPYIEDVEWGNRDFVADEDPDPLFDCTRDYVEQNDRYKAYQGKIIIQTTKDLVCQNCGQTFTAK